MTSSFSFLFVCLLLAGCSRGGGLPSAEQLAHSSGAQASEMEVTRSLSDQDFYAAPESSSEAREPEDTSHQHHHGMHHAH